MNRIERDIFKIITGWDYDEACRTWNHSQGLYLKTSEERAKLLAKKFEEGIKDAFAHGNIVGPLETEQFNEAFTDYLKSIKE